MPQDRPGPCWAQSSAAWSSLKSGRPFLIDSSRSCFTPSTDCRSWSASGVPISRRRRLACSRAFSSRNCCCGDGIIPLADRLLDQLERIGELPVDPALQPAEVLERQGVDFVDLAVDVERPGLGGQRGQRIHDSPGKCY